jgi:DNA (cytosine-5)-methyltransferase 1
VSVRRLLVADLFAGAGGTSTGALRAIRARGYEVDLVAVNHWDVAVATHTANHPEAAHHCVDLDSAKPLELVPEGRLDLLWASPSCTEHSYAKGGRPIDDQNRATAWCVVRWAETLLPKRIIVENVKQFLAWGPLDSKRRPIDARKGEIFQAWLKAIESLGYRVEHNILNAADYGVPQSRVRLFIQARRDRRRIVWPIATHGRTGLPWNPAREIIDWSLPAQSIFERDRPLAENTLRRIEEGIRRFCAPRVADAFLVVLRRNGGARSLDDAAPTVTSGGTHLGLAQTELRPFIVANRTNNVPKDPSSEPLPVVMTGGSLSLVEPFMVEVNHSGERAPRSVEGPLGTVTAKNGVGLAEPFVVSYYTDGGDGGSHKPRSVDDALPTVTTANRFGLVEPFIVPQQGDGVSSLDDPLQTVMTTSRGIRLVDPFLSAHFGERDGQKPRVHSIDAPAPTVTHRGAGDLVVPVLERVEGEAPSGRVVEIDGQLYVLDIRFRMLQPRELGRAQGFDDSYVFTGNKSETTAMIGNAVPVQLAQALVDAAIHDLPDRDAA